ncbi:MAG: TIR domain-containing protein [Betaproteobacteria bacterium]|nr:TIR domain-containing protein [Betaproteobacteria bacterium]
MNAIFLSYSSDDAAAARRICDALRAAGLEVWFDQSELRGGDAWDASIRKQIKECALFIPVISANTNARQEGYFRLEWKLAVDRMEMMAQSKPFLFPVLLDGTREPDALVPDKFRERQWTPLGDDASLRAFAARIAGVPQSQVASAASGKATPGGALAGSVHAAPTNAIGPSPVSRRHVAIGAGVLAAGAAIGMWRPWKAAAPPTSATPTNPNLARALQMTQALETTRADAALGEEMVKATLDKDPADTAAVLIMARVQVYMLMRGFDRSDERYQLAKTYVDRALALAPGDAGALATAANYFVQRRTELDRAAKLARQAIALAPDDPFAYRTLNNVLAATPNVPDETLILEAKRAAERFPNDALMQYDVARYYRDTGDVAEAEKYFDRAIKLGPVFNAVIARARLKLFVHRDPEGLKALLDTLPEKHRSGDRAVFGYFLYALTTGEFKVGLEALRQIADPWMSDFDYTGPTKLLTAELLHLQGKSDVATLRFREARDDLAKRKPVLTPVFNTVWLDAFVAWRLGDKARARQTNALVFAELPHPWRMSPATGWVFSQIALNLILGERANAIALMRECVKMPVIRKIIANALQLDPRMAAFRRDAEIAGILAEMPATIK